MHLVPQPDVVIYLKNDPDTILARKPELTREELERQGKACLQLIYQLKNGYIVETSGKVEETTRKVAWLLIDQMLGNSRSHQY